MAESEKPRVVSINMCTDQLLLGLADPAQILGVSRYGQDAALSFFAGRANTHEALSGSAEEVLKLQPDLVLAGTFTDRATREMLAAQGIPVKTFRPATTIEESIKQIGLAGEWLGQEERAAAIIAEIQREAAPAEARGVTALYYQRRGFVSGESSLVSDLFEIVGLENAAATFGAKRTGAVSLEQLISDPPDILVMADTTPDPADQGLALLSHPALGASVPPERRIELPQRLTVCGGPSVAPAIQHLRDAMRGLAATQ
ncbi:MAG: ABC transporter substrate-binding protein [Pseudomonadota bacterium]